MNLGASPGSGVGGTGRGLDEVAQACGSWAVMWRW